VKENPNAVRIGIAFNNRNPNNQGSRKRNPTVDSYRLRERCLLGFGSLRLGARSCFTDKMISLLYEKDISVINPKEEC
jgi:hypothetical protein